MVDPKKNDKVDQVRKFLDNQGLFYQELNNGQFKIDRVNLWATTEKWYDEVKHVKGQGINSFLKYVKAKDAQ